MYRTYILASTYTGLKHSVTVSYTYIYIYCVAIIVPQSIPTAPTSADPTQTSHIVIQK